MSLENKTSPRNRLPAITLSLPVAVILMAFFLAVGAVLVYITLQPKITSQEAVTATNTVELPTITLTQTPSATPEVTVQPSETPAPLPTLTPFTYTVRSGDTCTGIAAAFDVSVRSIVLANALPADCTTLFDGQSLLIPHPTPTALPPPTATLVGTAKAIAECEKVIYTVETNDTLSTISQNYAISMEAIKAYNGMTNNTVFAGLQLIIPLCERGKENVTPEPTLPPPYPASDLLLPRDGAFIPEDTLVLQWASVAPLGDNEAYWVTVVDITSEEERKLLAYVTGTSYQVSASFRHAGDDPHAYRWWVIPVRQTGTDENDEPVWTIAGETSVERIFVWAGAR